ncbi:hypothetical protein [Bradyrhizobium sp. USDA 4350]
MTNQKTVSLTDLFTAEELDAAVELYDSCSPGTFNAAVVQKIVQPALPRINQVTGQENDAKYWGYALEHAISSYRQPKP